MPIETPHEIALRLLGADSPQFVPYGNSTGALDLHALIRAAIEADREQHLRNS